MSLQMRHECCENNGTLDLDRVLREIQEKGSEVKGFSRIGPFGVLSVEKGLSQPIFDVCSLASVPVEDQRVEEVPKISTPDINFAVSQIDWDKLESLQTWESIIVSDDMPMNSESWQSKEALDYTLPLGWELSTSVDAIGYTYHATDGADIVNVYEQETHLGHVGDSNRLIRECLESQTDEARIFPVGDSGACSIAATESQSLNHSARSPSILTMSNDANLSKIPDEARLLLDYYSERIIDVMSMSTTNKPPWKTIHLPCAMSAFADLAVHGEGRSLARMALFYALLSISSFHIGFAHDDENSLYWRERGELHKKKSESFLRSALRNDMPKSARGKYKELLMSGLSMVTIGVR